MVIKNILCFCLVLILLAQSSYQTVYISEPAVTPFERNELPYMYTNFGVIHYNKPMSYEIFVTNQTLCEQVGQTKLQHFKKPTFIVVSDRGSCSFPKKALKAEEFGAQGIIFGSNDIDYAIEGVVMADDGNGRKVKIPALFISPVDMQSLSQLKNAKIKVNFPIKKSSKSQVTLFITGGNRHNYIFLRDFYQYYLKVKQQIKLSVVYHTIECEYCDQSECILQNRCCAFDSENYQMGNGRYIVEQQFRQYKIFQLFQSEGTPEKWFQYMNLFDQNCDNDWINSQTCSKQMLERMGITKKLKLIDEFDTMMGWRRQQTKAGVFSYPDLVVNGVRHEESLTVSSSFSMICESLSTPPDECFKKQSQPKGNKAGLIVGIVIACVVLLGLGIYCYRKVFRKQITNDMSSRVNELVAKYASKVSEQKKKRKDRLMEKMTEEL